MTLQTETVKFSIITQLIPTQTSMFANNQKQLQGIIENGPNRSNATRLWSYGAVRCLADISNEERKDKVPRNLRNRSITTNGKIYRRREVEIEQFSAQRQVQRPHPQPIHNSNELTPFSNQIESNSEQSSSQKSRTVQIQVSSYDSSQEISGFFQDQAQMMNENGEYLDIQLFILQNHIGQCEKYRLPGRNIQIYDSFYDKEKYEDFMLELVKYEIIADVNRRIQEKNQEKYQGQIRVQLSSELVKDRYSDQYKKIVILKAEGRNHYFIEEALIKGKRLGLITRSQRFRTEDLISKQFSTNLCIIWKDQKTQNIMVRGLDELQIPRPTRYVRYTNRYSNDEQQPLQEHQYYFMDLDSIISSIRQYKAIEKILDSPLIKAIINNVPVKPNVKYQKQRKGVLKGSNVFHSIKKTRNNSQVNTIKAIFQKESGIFLIQGPPGTGKTQSIANFASLEQQYFKTGGIKQNEEDNKARKLMICAQANAAVNHIGRKLLKDKMIGRVDMPKILRLGHTEEFDELLLSINLPHLCQIKLRKTQDNDDDWSAKLRWQKLLLREKINRMMEDTPKQRKKIWQAKDQLFQKVKRLVEINEELVGQKSAFEEIEEQLMMESEIVLTTLNTSGKKRFAQFYHNRIRCLLIDEASQATEPSTLIPFGTNVQKVILVGDHMQLQPTVMSTNCRYTKYNRSLFERLAIKKSPLLLDTQYRMVQTLMDFPNEQFYGGRLICGRDMKKYPVPFSLMALKSSSMFFDVAHGKEEVMKKSFINEEEAKCVSILIKRLVNLASELSIGVIAPYKGQVKLIQSMVYKEVVDKRDSLRISTVDAFQGQERDVIIISTVRNNPERNIGFVRDEKRLNVAITRSKNALFVFGSANTLSSNGTWAEYLNYHRFKGSLHSLPQDQKKCDTAIRLKIELQKA